MPSHDRLFLSSSRLNVAASATGVSPTGFIGCRTT